MEFTFRDESGGERRFSPNRDIAIFAPELIEQLEEHLTNRLDDADMELLGRYAPQLMAGYGALCRFTRLACDPDLTTVQSAATASGLLDVPDPVLRLVLEKFGRICLGAFWAGIRSSVMIDECPPILANLLRRGNELLAARAPQPTP